MFSRFLLDDVDLRYVPREKTDFLVIGSGVAGLFAAREASAYGRVTLVTKESLADCNTTLAQGGIASALAPGDSPEFHFQDTLLAGAGLNDHEAVRVLVGEGPQRVWDLIKLEVPFDQGEEGLAFTREGAHSYRRILHAGGDATGQVVWQALMARALEHQGLDIRQEAMAVDLLLAGEVQGLAVGNANPDRCCGALILNQRTEELMILEASRATILASGGAAQVYLHNTNPAVTTGDGLVMAFRAGAVMADMEFVQFHPTVLWHPEARGFLISEAVRGEGGILRNRHGEAFMIHYHDLADLAPRDVVARAMLREMCSNGDSHLYLDVTHMGSEFFQQRFPTICRTCRRVGLNPARDWIPVAPAAHFLMGGVVTDTWGATSIAGLYACGEVAASGVHGANRLASNSLLEGLVFSHRAVKHAIGMGPIPGLGPRWGSERVSMSQAAPDSAKAGLPNNTEVIAGSGQRQGPVSFQELKSVMENLVGISRNREGLDQALNFVQGLLSRTPAIGPFSRNRESIEFLNQLAVAYLIIRSALAREESRGAHYRKDFPQAVPEWVGRHVYLRRDRCGEVHLELQDFWLPGVWP